MSVLGLIGEIVRDAPCVLASMARDALDPAPRQRDAWAAVTGKPGRWAEVLERSKAIAKVTPWTVQDIAEAHVALAQLGWPLDLILTGPVDGWADFIGFSHAVDAARAWDALRRAWER